MQGPKLGSLKQTIEFFPILFKPSFKPTEVVVFPSPAGVGVIAETNIKLPFFFFLSLFKNSKFNFSYVPAHRTKSTAIIRHVNFA